VLLQTFKRKVGQMNVGRMREEGNLYAVECHSDRF